MTSRDVEVPCCDLHGDLDDLHDLDGDLAMTLVEYLQDSQPPLSLDTRKFQKCSTPLIDKQYIVQIDINIFKMVNRLT